MGVTSTREHLPPPEVPEGEPLSPLDKLLREKKPRGPLSSVPPWVKELRHDYNVRGVQVPELMEKYGHSRKHIWAIIYNKSHIDPTYVKTRVRQ